MRLLVGFLVVLAALFAVQSVRPNCSMTDMVGVEWLQCLTR
jgi:hypothetical protein